MNDTRESTYRQILHYDASRPCCESPVDGDLFPDLTRLEFNAENRGRVASIIVESVGIGVQSKAISIDETAWKECIKHPNFRACYDLSMAKVALQQALLDS
jgi:hypothetical protein